MFFFVIEAFGTNAQPASGGCSTQRVWDYPNKHFEFSGKGPENLKIRKRVLACCACYVTDSLANKTFPNFKTTRKIDLWIEKSAKNRGRLRVLIKRKQRMFYSSSVSSSSGCLIFKAPSMAPSTIGRYCSGQSFSLWLTRFRSSLSSRMTSGLK